jgi:Divergent InlB B-repeat domain
MRSRIALALIAGFCLVLVSPANTARAGGTVALTIGNPYPAGAGTVTSSDGFISCPGSCTHNYSPGDSVTLTFHMNGGFVFKTWSAADSTPSSCSTLTCTFKLPTLVAQTSIFADSDYSTFNVTATTTGNGSGHISGLGTYNAGSTATLTAVASAGSVFSGWQPSGDVCSIGGKGGGTQVSTTNPCTFQLSGWSKQTLNAVAEFDKSAASAPQPPTAAAPATQPTPTSVASATPSPTPPAPGSAQARVVLQQVKVDGTIVQRDCALTVPNNQVLSLAGTTVPRGLVTLVIHSSPQSQTVTADASGRWSYTISGLKPGAHRIDGSLTDPATHKIYPSETLISFHVAGSSQSAASPSYPDVWLVLMLALLAAGLVIAVPALRRRIR